MIRINIYEAKTHLSKYIERLERGEVIVLCRRNVPIAEIRRLSKRPIRKRRLGFWKGRVRLKPSFFDPLPESILKDFEGRGT